MTYGVFISSTGTGAGKTFVARGLAAALRARGMDVAALKPIETGCDPDPLDALALDRAAGSLGFGDDPGFYRARLPVCPRAAVLEGESPVDVPRMLGRIRQIGLEHDVLVVEGAGGLLVPIDRSVDTSDLIQALGLPLVLVAPNRLGVLSHLLATFEAAVARSLRVACIVLTEPDQRRDESSRTNAMIVRERLDVPVVEFPSCLDDDVRLAEAAEASGLLTAAGLG